MFGRFYEFSFTYEKSFEICIMIEFDSPEVTTDRTLKSNN